MTEKPKEVIDKSFRDIWIHRKMVELQEDETALQCQCGRMLTKRHCPRCGSTRGYALSSEGYECPFDFGDGVLTNVVVSMFRCTNCNKCYDEVEWLTACKATPKNAEMRAAVVHKLRLQQRSDEERKALVKDAMNRFGPNKEPPNFVKHSTSEPNDEVGLTPVAQEEEQK
jgi:hypothetical protein